MSKSESLSLLDDRLCHSRMAMAQARNRGTTGCIEILAALSVKDVRSDTAGR